MDSLEIFEFEQILRNFINEKAGIPAYVRFKVLNDLAHELDIQAAKEIEQAVQLRKEEKENKENGLQ